MIPQFVIRNKHTGDFLSGAAKERGRGADAFSLKPRAAYPRQAASFSLWAAPLAARAGGAGKIGRFFAAGGAGDGSGFFSARSGAAFRASGFGSRRTASRSFWTSRI